jgi:hypothetical protein
MTCLKDSSSIRSDEEIWLGDSRVRMFDRERALPERAFVS